MSKFQLWSRDEYGQGSILMTSEDINEVVKRGKKEVTELNVNNALTSDDRERNWEAYMVQVSTSKRSKTRYIYGGEDPHIKNVVYVIDKNDNIKSVALKDVPEAQIKVYLGNVSTTRQKEEDWFAKDVRRKEITTADHPDLQDKTSFFIKVI